MFLKAYVGDTEITEVNDCRMKILIRLAYSFVSLLEIV